MNRNRYFAGCELHSDLQLNALDVKFDAEVPDGFITGTASTPTIDLHGHRVLPGAFDESIKARGFEGGQGIKLLAYHDRTKVAGMVKQLQTINNQLKIAAQLFLNVGYVKDLYEVSKQTKGLNFSVGFRLQDFKFVEENKEDILVVEKGDLVEVSIVAFPAQSEAKMEFIKTADTPSEFEKALIANGWAMSRNEAHKLMQLCRNSIHLLDQTPVLAARNGATHPVLDAPTLKAASDLALKVKTLLGAR